MPERPVILFDGVCNYCNGWVNFIIKHDRKNKFLFTPLQGKSAPALLEKYHINITELNSVILIDNGKAYTQSSAGLKIFRHLNGGWKIVYGFMIVPGFIRDFFYNIIARNRYRWYGRKDQCMTPAPEIKERFLD